MLLLTCINSSVVIFTPLISDYATAFCLLLD